MGIHFYTESPSDDVEQKGRLRAPAALLEAGIPCVVFGEDALSIIYCVPTVCFDLHLLVRETDLASAVTAICNSLPYCRALEDSTNDWRDSRVASLDRPHAFALNESTVLLTLTDPSFDECWVDRILLHAGHVFRFDVEDDSKTCLNPKPPNAESRAVRFPTLAALYDALISTYHEYSVTLPARHDRFESWLETQLSYLNLYHVSNHGWTTVEENMACEELIPACLDVVESVQPENRPFLIRDFLGGRVQPLELPFSVIERDTIREELCLLSGNPRGFLHRPLPPTAYELYARAKNEPWEALPETRPKLTPYVLRGYGGRREIVWRALSRYAHIAHRMLR